MLRRIATEGGLFMQGEIVNSSSVQSEKKRKTQIEASKLKCREEKRARRLKYRRVRIIVGVLLFLCLCVCTVFAFVKFRAKVKAEEDAQANALLEANRELMQTRKDNLAELQTVINNGQGDTDLKCLDTELVQGGYNDDLFASWYAKVCGTVKLEYTDSTCTVIRVSYPDYSKMLNSIYESGELTGRAVLKGWSQDDFAIQLKMQRQFTSWMLSDSTEVPLTTACFTPDTSEDCPYLLDTGTAQGDGSTDFDKFIDTVLFCSDDFHLLEDTFAILEVSDNPASFFNNTKELTLSNSYTEGSLITHTWCGVAVPCVSEPVMSGDGTADSPYTFGTPFVTKVLCANGKYEKVGVVVQSVCVDNAAADFANALSEFNRGQLGNSQKRLVCYTAKVYNLSGKKIRFDSEMCLCDKYGNPLISTGSLKGFTDTDIVLKRGASTDISGWVSSLDIDKAWLSWGKSFSRKYKVCYTGVQGVSVGPQSN